MTRPDDTEPSAEAGEFYRDEIIPWMMKYSITPQDQHERDIMLILDRFRAAERERCAKIADKYYWHPVIAERIRSGETP